MGKTAAYGMLGRRGKGEGSEGQETSQRPCFFKERELDRLISKFVYESARSPSSDEATCLGDRVEWTALSWQRAGVVAGQSNASEPSAGARVLGEISTGSPPSRARHPE